jgi:transposase
MSAPDDTSRSERVDELKKQVESLRDRLEKVLAENERLRKELDEALRALKRQAAPFSRGQPKRNPKRPGRKPGSSYGRQALRPAPKRIDEEIAVPLPQNCVGCGGSVRYRGTRPQFQEDIVRLTIVRQFNIEVGQCRSCGRHVQGRHPLQTSDALGAAHVQLGPEAISLAAHLTKAIGLSYDDAAEALRMGYGLHASRSGLCRAVLRLGEKAAPTYERLRFAIRKSPVAWLDETGWKVAGVLRWLWVAVSEEATVFAILPGRGFTEAAFLLGQDYDGFLHHDGWRPYYRFVRAYHQSCLSHLIRRCRDMVGITSRSAARFPFAVKQLLQKALVLRDRHRAGMVSVHGLAVATGRLEVSMDRLLDRSFRSAANRRLARHLDHERQHLFTFLHCPGLDATNNEAERALRPAVVARKTWGGNRTWRGARVQQMLTSVLRTCWQQGEDAFPRMIGLLRASGEQCLDIVPAALSP